MVNTSTVCGALVLVAFVISGCGDMERDAPVRRIAGTKTDALLYTPQTFPRLFAALVGKGLNGRRLAGELLDGHYVIGVSLDGVALPDGRTKAATLQATTFRMDAGEGDSGSARSRKRLIGAVFTATLEDGSTLPLRIDDVVQRDGPFEHDLFRYAISYPADGVWQPYCGVDDRGAPILAIPLSGLWDYREGVPTGGAHIDDERSFTFGCEGYALAKCVDMGYKPWSEGRLCDEEARGRDCVPYALADHHQACTRMLRADYCGDGTSYTDDSTLINAYDGVGIRLDTEAWLIEAEWNADGAICVRRERLDPPLGPSCWEQLLDDTCGDPEHFDQGTLLVSEDPS